MRCAAPVVLAATLLALPGTAAQRPSAARTAAKVVDAKPIGQNTASGGVRVRAPQKEVEIEAVIAKRGHDDVLKGAIEYLLVSKGGKAYESVFETEVKADALDRALKQVGLKPGGPPNAPEAPPTGAGVALTVLWKDEAGKEQRLPAEALVTDVETGRPLAEVRWTYTGSKITEDPATNRKVLMALQTNNLVSTHREDPTVLLMNPLPGASGKRYKRNEDRLPKEGTKVRLIFSPAK